MCMLLLFLAKERALIKARHYYKLMDFGLVQDQYYYWKHNRTVILPTPHKA